MNYKKIIATSAGTLLILLPVGKLIQTQTTTKKNTPQTTKPVNPNKNKGSKETSGNSGEVIQANHQEVVAEVHRVEVGILLPLQHHQI